MRSRSMVLLALALGCGLVASIGISQVMDRRGSAEGAPSEMEPILVAAANIHYNEQLKPELVRFEEWPKGKVPPGAITRLEELQGRHTSTTLVEGEPILTGKLIGADGLGAARKIPKGYRVVSVSVDAVTGASSLIMPDDRVDVLASLTRDVKGVQVRNTKTILSDVRVFAVDTEIERHHGADDKTANAKTVALLLTPDQAEKLTLATEMGKIRLVMRSPDDGGQETSTGASSSDIYGEEPTVAGDPIQPGAVQGLYAPPRQSENASAAVSAPAPVPMAAAVAPPATWTMVLIEGSEMRHVELSANSQFAPIQSEHIDYQPDPTPPPVQPPVVDGSSSTNPDDGVQLEQPTAGDDGLGSITEVPNL
jgi:pilus assembly protein CpaB